MAMEVDITALVVRVLGEFPALRLVPRVVVAATMRVMQGLDPDHWDLLDSELGATSIAGTAWCFIQGREVNCDGGCQTDGGER